MLSVAMIATLIAAITFAPTPGQLPVSLVLLSVSLVGFVTFYVHEKRVAHPIFSLVIAKRRTFWVAAVAGLIVFGSLMGAMFIGQQFLQNVLSYSPFQAGVGILPAAAAMILLSPVAAILMRRLGSRLTLAIGFVLVGLGFAGMFLWSQSSPYWVIALTYAVLGSGIAVAAAPASRSIMSSVPAQDLGMGSATNDLQRDLGGAIMQAVMGSLLVVRYSKEITAAFDSAPSSDQAELSSQAITLMTQSFAGAQQAAQSLAPADANALVAAAREAFISGSNVAYAAALISVVAGLAIILALYPRKEKEAQVLAEYAQTDQSQTATSR